MLCGAQIGQSKSCNSKRSAAFSCQPSIQMCLTGSLTRCSSISAISRRFRSANDPMRPNIRSPRTGFAPVAACPAVMKALGPKQVVLAPPRHHVAEIEQPREMPPRHRGSTGNSPGCIRRSGSPAACPAQSASAASRSRSSSPSRNFCGNPRRSCRARHPSICPAHEAVPARLDAGERADGRALHFRNGLADFSEHALLVLFRQRRPRLRAEDARQAA